MSARLSTFLHTLSLTAAIVFVYIWVHQPQLDRYSLQAFAGVGVLYFITKALTKSKAWHVLPTKMSIETSLATMAFLLLIGATGNTASWFYPLTYIHLFFIVFSSETITAIIVTILIMLFHYGVSPQLLQHEIVSILTLPIIMVFFLFAKNQHEEAVRDQLVISEEEEQLHNLQSEEFKTENFLEFYLKPELEKAKQTIRDTNSLNLVATHLDNIKAEVERLLAEIK